MTRSQNIYSLYGMNDGKYAVAHPTSNLSGQNTLAAISSNRHIILQVLLYYMKHFFNQIIRLFVTFSIKSKGKNAHGQIWKPPRSWTMHVGQGRSFCCPHLPLGPVPDRSFDHQRYVSDGVRDCCIGVVGSLCLCWILKVDARLWPGFLPLTVTAQGTQKAATFDLWKIYPDASYKTCPSTHKPGSQIFLCGGHYEITINIFCLSPKKFLLEDIIYFVHAMEFVRWSFLLLSAVHFLCPLQSIVCDP